MRSDDDLRLEASEVPGGLAEELLRLRRAAERYLATSDPLPPDGVDTSLALMRALRGERAD